MISKIFVMGKPYIGLFISCQKVPGLTPETHVFKQYFQYNSVISVNYDEHFNENRQFFTKTS
jgi:uncharacterized protein VirK/YbjX